MSNRCLICRKSVENGEPYHPRCSRSFFGSHPAPELHVSLDDLREFAARSVLQRVTVTGVQKKLSLGLEKAHGRESRFTVVGLWGTFILKPPVGEYPSLPENEDTIMRLAAAAGIPTVPHAMIRLGSGELAYITRRIDRDPEGKKLAMEDFCQLSGRMTEDKYRGSIERVGKLLRIYSIFPGLDVAGLFERVVFNYLCGNGDMHLKNYSLIETAEGMRLAPAYDLVSTVLAIPDDAEESALTINGKKNRLTREDFDELGEQLKIPVAAKVKVYRNMAGCAEAFRPVMNSSLLPEDQRIRLQEIIAKRCMIFNL